jgi:hypothetical protein
MSASLVTLFIQPLKEAEITPLHQSFSGACLVGWPQSDGARLKCLGHRTKQTIFLSSPQEMKADLPGCWKLGGLSPRLCRAFNKLWCECGLHKNILCCQKSSLRPVKSFKTSLGRIAYHQDHISSLISRALVRTLAGLATDNQSHHSSERRRHRKLFCRPQNSGRQSCQIYHAEDCHTACVRGAMHIKQSICTTPSQATPHYAQVQLNQLGSCSMPHAVESLLTSRSVLFALLNSSHHVGREKSGQRLQSYQSSWRGY